MQFDMETFKFIYTSETKQNIPYSHRFNGYS